MHSVRGFIRRMGLILVTGLVASALAGQAAAGTLDEVKKRGRLIAGVKTDFPPFGYVDSAGKNLGFDVDIAHLFAKALFDDETKVELVAVTSGNRIPFLQSGKIDIIIASVTVTDERRQVVEFSEPYFMSGGLLLVPKNSSIKGVEDLAGKTVAVIQGAIQDKDIEQLAPKAARVKFGKVSEAVLAVKGGRADAFSQDDILILTLAKENPDLKPVGKPFTPRPYGIAVRKGEGEFVKWVDGQLLKLKKDGTYDKLWKKYFGEVEANLFKP
ncbi:MAG TPA: transporter substrate-binding domain-containing protein [Candidatus Methylomirabilis sp.]|nr:transporter substrate-binding domain-containing protein [Candidatus Methylomirabilis sp.]